MGIPDRFYRIAKHKLGEMKDWFDKVDEEEEFESDAQRRRIDPRTDANRELRDSLAPSGASGGSGGTSGMPRDTSGIPVNPPRTQQASGGARPGSYTPSYNTSAMNTSGSGSAAGNSYNNTPTGSTTPQADPLDYHYKLLGLESGADFAAVQSAYNKLAARCDPARFPAGSQEEQQARQIRQRLDTSFKQLRESLDSTSTRFGLLEFDDIPKPKNLDEDNSKGRK